MWYKSSNGSLDIPSELDVYSSKVYVILRKDFVVIPETGEGEEIIPAHYEWMECRIPKEDWEIYKKALGHDEALDDVYAALTELAEMIVGE